MSVCPVSPPVSGTSAKKLRKSVRILPETLSVQRKLCYNNYNQKSPRLQYKI